MQIFIVLSFLILLFAIIFALQNTVAVTIYFLFWQFRGSLALVLIVSLAAGLAISFLAYLPTLLRGQWSGRKLRKQIAELEASLEEHKQHLEEALLTKKPPSEPNQSPERPGASADPSSSRD